MPVVFAIVTVVEPSVVVPDKANGATAPQLLDIVSVWAAMLYEQLFIKVVKAASDSLQADTFNDVFTAVSGADCNELQTLNMLLKLRPAAVLSGGIVSNEMQLPNIEVKLVPAAVLRSGIVFNEEQLINILLKLIPATVFKRGIVCSE